MGYYSQSVAVLRALNSSLLSAFHFQRRFLDPDTADLSLSLPSASCCLDMLQLHWAEGQNFQHGRHLDPYERRWLPPDSYVVARETFFAGVAAGEQRPVQGKAWIPLGYKSALFYPSAVTPQQEQDSLISAVQTDPFVYSKLKQLTAPLVRPCLRAFLTQWESRFKRLFGFPLITNYIRDMGSDAVFLSQLEPTANYKRKFAEESMNACEGLLYGVRVVNAFGPPGRRLGWVDHAFAFCLPAECTKEVVEQRPETSGHHLSRIAELKKAALELTTRGGENVNKVLENEDLGAGSGQGPAGTHEHDYYPIDKMPLDLILPAYTLDHFSVLVEELTRWRDLTVVDFLVIGFAKCGTTSLAFALQNLPFVQMAGCGYETHCESFFWSYENAPYLALPGIAVTQLKTEFALAEAKARARGDFLLKGAKDPRIIESDLQISRIRTGTRLVVLVQDPLDALLAHYNEMKLRPRNFIPIL